MPSLILNRACPHCGSDKLTFLEHGAGGTVFQCGLCARATIQRWEPLRPPVVKTPASDAFVFPSWYTGVSRD